MGLHRLIILGILASAIISSPGCIIGNVYVPAGDPLASKFVGVAKVEGITVHLADGRAFDLAGVDVSRLSKFQLALAQSRLQRWLIDCKLGVLVYEDSPGKARFVVSVPHGRDNLDRPLIKVEVPVPPEHVDVASEVLIAEGNVYANADELRDESVRKDYQDAAEKAARGNVGLYLPINEQLCRAAYYGDPAEVARLIDAGADPSALPACASRDGFYYAPLINVIHGWKMQESLRNYDLDAAAVWPDDNRLDDAAVFRIVRGDHIKTMEILLQRGANPNVVDGKSCNSNSPRGIIRGEYRDEALNGSIDDTALNCALSQLVDFEFIRLLLKYKADPNLPGDYGRRPLNVICGKKFDQYDMIPRIRALVAAGADVNLANKNHSLLAYPIQWKQIEVVEFLIKNGVDVNDASGGILPMTLARQVGLASMIDMLRRNGAKE